MLSGALLIKRYNDEFNTKQFFKRRFLRVLIPHCIAYLFVFTYYMILHPTHFRKNWIFGVLFSFLGLDFFGSPFYEYFSQYGIWSYWLVGEWFTTVILILYLLFPILRWLFKKCKIFGTILITAIFIVNLKYQILAYSSGWFSLTNCLMCFWLGMLIEPIKHKFKGAEILVCLIGCILIYTLQPKEILGYAYLAPFLFSIMLFVLLTRCNVNTKFTNYICKYNYEIYLIHHRVFILIMPYLLTKMTTVPTQILIMLVMFWITCKLSEYLQILSNRFIDRINSTEFKKFHFPKFKFKKKVNIE